MTKNVLVVVGHADDETLGCGGVIAKHSRAGDTVKVIVVADGVTSRDATVTNQGVTARDGSFVDAMSILGVSDMVTLNYPDNQLDTIPLLDIVKELECVLAAFPAEVVYTHFPEDLNIDHRVTTEAVLTACRPQPGMAVREILLFEVMSATGWGNTASGGLFNPNYFVDISDCLDLKLKALQCYDEEMRDFPHARSYEAIRALAKLRGASVGLEAAEAFMLARKIL